MLYAGMAAMYSLLLGTSCLSSSRCKVHKTQALHADLGILPENVIKSKSPIKQQVRCSGFCFQSIEVKRHVAFMSDFLPSALPQTY